MCKRVCELLRKLLLETRLPNYVDAFCLGEWETCAKISMKQNLARNPRAKGFAGMRLEEIREFEGQRVDESTHPLRYLLVYIFARNVFKRRIRYCHIDYTTIYVNRRESRRERGPEEKERARRSWDFLAARIARRPRRGRRKLAVSR